MTESKSGSEHPLVRFLTLRYAMGPMQFIIAIVIVAIVSRAAAAFAGVFSHPGGALYAVIALALSWVVICLSSARLRDAGLPRFLSLFTAVIPILLGIYILAALQAMPLPGLQGEHRLLLLGLSIVYIVAAVCFLLFAPSRLHADAWQGREKE